MGHWTPTGIEPKDYDDDDDVVVVSGKSDILALVDDKELQQ